MPANRQQMATASGRREKPGAFRRSRLGGDWNDRNPVIKIAFAACGRSDSGSCADTVLSDTAANSVLRLPRARALWPCGKRATPVWMQSVPFLPNAVGFGCLRLALNVAYCAMSARHGCRMLEHDRSRPSGALDEILDLRTEVHDGHPVDEDAG